MELIMDQAEKGHLRIVFEVYRDNQVVVDALNRIAKVLKQIGLKKE